MTAAAPRVQHVTGPIRILEDLIAYRNELDDARRESLFEFGDVVAAYLAANANGDGETPAAMRTMCRAIAAGSRLSGGFLYNLVRVARAFPADLRDAYAEQSWGWFLECIRERDPLAAAERYAELSIGQIKDLRKTKQIAREPGSVRLQLTLRPDQIADLKGGRKVTLTRLLPDGDDVTIVMTARQSTL